VTFQFEPLEIPEVVLIRGARHGDSRGWFTETYKRSEFARHGIDENFKQDNESFSSRRGTLRGLHYQRPPYAQGKLVRCLAGAIYDVAVDARRGSPTVGRHVAIELRPGDGTILWIPSGFAHGYLTLEPDTHVSYKTTAEYDPLSESGIRWDDKTIAIQWPLSQPIVSDKDATLPTWQSSTSPFTR
jgi:dTDP-4-dehydrorhamnose 3,5-epimerase